LIDYSLHTEETRRLSAQRTATLCSCNMNYKCMMVLHKCWRYLPSCGVSSVGQESPDERPDHLS